MRFVCAGFSSRTALFLDVGKGCRKRCGAFPGVGKDSALSLGWERVREGSGVVQAALMGACVPVAVTCWNAKDVKRPHVNRPTPLPTPES